MSYHLSKSPCRRPFHAFRGAAYFLLFLLASLTCATAQDPDIVADLVWDNGSQELGDPSSYQTPEDELITGDFLFRITTNNPSTGAWRTILNVLEGEADLYLKRGAIPDPEESPNFTKRSTRASGDDGLVLAPSEFAPGEEWYVLIRCLSARWRVFTGEVFIRDLGTLGYEDANENGAFDNGEIITPTQTSELTVGAEGSLFFKALVPDGAAAWAISVLSGDPYIYVKKSAVPVGNVFERRQQQRMLLVPDYLQASSAGATYFIRIEGDPGDSYQLDSRLHSFTELDFHSTQSVSSTKGGYQTFRYTVPPNQLAWDLSITPTEGNPDICLRRDQIPSEVENDAFSEATDLAADGITLSPSAVSNQDGLTDGVFFLTVYSDGPYTADLTSGAITVESINFTDSQVNSVPEKAGWRYYVIDDIESQTGLGWELELEEFAEETEIAIRRNAVPSRWRYRQGGSTAVRQSNGNLDMSSDTGLLQNPRHQKDVWYVGVFQPNEPLGEFIINARPIGGQPLDFNNGVIAKEGHVKDKKIYYRVDVPADSEGWYLSVDQIVPSGTTGTANLAIAVAKEGLPVLTNNELERSRLVSLTGSTWASGEYWKVPSDWTNKTSDNDGSRRYSFCLSKGRPLEPGTYYLGIQPATPIVDYRIRSQGIGEGAQWGIPIQPLSLAGEGSSALTQLGIGEIQVFKTVVDASVPDWHLSLTDTEGDSFLAISRDRIAGSSAKVANKPHERAGSLAKRDGKEHFTFLSDSAQESLEPGNYYVTVVGQGHVPEDWTNAAQPATASLQSHGALTVASVGTATETGVVFPFSIEPGEIKPIEFTLPADAFAVEANLTLTSGNAAFSWWTGPNKRIPKPSSSRSETYGFAGGEDGRGPRTDEIDPKFYFTSRTPPVITTTGLAANAYRLTLRADSASEGGTATGEITIKILKSTAVAFDGGEVTVNQHAQDSWQYFAFDVPSGILGWDLRIQDVVSAGAEPNPAIALEAVIQRDLPPPASGASLRPSSSLWPSGAKWTMGLDSTEELENPDGSKHYGAVLPAGRPLEPGHYILGIKAKNDKASYKVTSKGIGIEQSIQVAPLNFGATISTQVANLQPREIRYFKISVPEEVPSWSITGDASLGNEDFRMILRKDGIPGSGATKGGQSIKDHGSLIAKSEPGNDPLEQEYYAVFPKKGDTALAAGDYYLAVLGVGRPNDGDLLGDGTSTVQLNMVSPIPVTHMGTAPGSEPVLSADFNLRSGSLALFDANIVENGSDVVSAVLSRLEGNPGFTRYVGDSNNFPTPPTDGPIYGFEGGEAKVGGAVLGICDDLEAGTNRFVVRAMRDINGIYSPAVGNLQIRECGEVPSLEFDGGSAFKVVTRAFQFYRVDVPTDALGWQLKLSSFEPGSPGKAIDLEFVIRRDTLPVSTSAGVSERNTEWLSGRTYNAGRAHWTKVTKTNAGARSYCSVIPMGQPLEAGRYYIGIRTRSSIAIAATTIESTGIGTGYTHIPVDLAFAGTEAQAQLPLLESQATQFYKIDVPPTTRSWQIGIDVTRGDFAVAVAQGRIPGSASIANQRPELNHGWLNDKPGNERLHLLPKAGSEYVAEGTYYVAVASKGAGGTSSTGGAEPG